MILKVLRLWDSNLRVHDRVVDNDEVRLGVLLNSLVSGRNT